MPATTTYRDASIRHLLTGPTGPVVRRVDNVARRVGNAARRLAPSRSGALRGSIREVILLRGSKVVGRVYTPLAYGRYQHEGTGVYAGRGPIRPKRAKVLAFVPKGKKKTVFAMKVKGTPPKKYLLRALYVVSEWPVREYNRG